MKSERSSFGQRVCAIALPFLAILVAFSCIGLFSGVIMAQDKGTPEKEWEDFDPSNFDHRSTNIDNEWFPLKPGMQWVYEGATVEDDESVPHRVVFTVTDLIKVIDGVRAVVCWDQDYSAGEVVETEIVFFAQDKNGTVWHLGQYPEEYEDGEFVLAPCWIAGIKDGKAGIMMKVEPKLGTPSYSQGWAPSVDWTDRGVVDQMGQKTTVPTGSYEDVLVIAETSKEEPNAYQLKYYARGVGNVRVGWRGEDATQETLELFEVRQLSPDALAEARAEALKLEKRAYEISKDVYAHTSPAERMKKTNAQ
ncbi:hypothetical protein GWN28_04790 [candidate division KSB1 bacterium]|nr:hypothetical protein [Phycisphaerae bacterium]NIU10475.1 hypothetical protein [Phycisphaerae bacterium]NIW17711.1 hypothetical protein [candidate division KSB1 bacterium]NIX30107.1 hypothetical protein [Phycisphaerae bacterium]